VKKAVVEFDEFELDVRRSMNYGHSFGHAIEALTDYKVVHGAGVALGIIVENEISFRRGILSKLDRDRILNLTNQLLSEEIFKLFRQASMDGILELLKRDKKAEGPILKVATLARVGRIDFIDLRLDHTGETEVRDACASVVDALTSLRHV
jgi:3-dehydroquinate synthase